jgi:hypothetical protein
MSQPAPAPSSLPPELRTRGNADIMLMRSIIGFLGAWAHCRKACRRHKRCASPAVACFDANIETIREQLEALAAWPRLDGPRDPAALNERVDKLFD